MAYRVQLTRTVAKLLAKLHPELKKRTKTTLQEIAQNPYLGKELQGDLEGFLSYRFKRYKVIYTVEEKAKTVIVHLAWHRRDVYELFAKLIASR